MQRKTGFPKEAGFAAGSYFTKQRYRKVTIWPLRQSLPGAKVVAVVPEVMPFYAAQRTAS